MKCSRSEKKGGCLFLKQIISIKGSYLPSPWSAVMNVLGSIIIFIIAIIQTIPALSSIIIITITTIIQTSTIIITITTIITIITITAVIKTSTIIITITTSKIPAVRTAP